MTEFKVVKEADIKSIAAKTVFLWEEYIKTKSELLKIIKGKTDKKEWTQSLYTDGFNVIVQDKDLYVSFGDLIALTGFSDVVITEKIFKSFSFFSNDVKYRSSFYDENLCAKRNVDDTAIKIFMKKEGIKES